MPVTLHLPETAGVVDGAGQTFDMESFMGTWHVVWSTLPLWKDKKDVRITYSSTPSSSSSSSSTGELKFDDLVEYKKQSASADSKSSTVKGIDTLDSTSPNPQTFNWRGKGMLMIATSRWQLLGTGKQLVQGENESQNKEIEWVVTYFAKTIFTPAGLDIYLRTPLVPSSPSNDPARMLVEEIKTALIGLGGEVAEMARGGFVVGEKVD